MNSRNDFYITLFSNDSINFFPNNTLSTFENRVPTHIDLTKGDWRVGLSEIFINDYLQTDEYVKEKCVTIELGVYEVIVGKNREKVQKRMGYTFYPEESSKFTNDDWKINFLPTIINNITPVGGFTRDQLLREFETEVNTILLSDAIYTNSIYKAVSEPDQLKLVRLAKTFDSESYFLKQNHNYTLLELLKDLFRQKKDIGNYKLVIIDYFKKAMVKYKDEKSGMVMVYSDIIQPEIYGNNQIRALRAININNCRKEYNIEFKNIQYVPVEKNIFETIAINISDQYGKHFKKNFDS